MLKHEILGKLKPPAIGLIITGVLNGLFSLYVIGSSLLRFTIDTSERDFVSDAERIGFNLGYWGLPLWGLICLIIAPILILGGIRMIQGKSYGFVKASAILAIIPLTSCCFIFGMPFGIWAFVVLRSTEVIVFFNGEVPAFQNYPPQPPFNR